MIFSWRRKESQRSAGLADAVPAQLTDRYLLALAVEYQMSFVTLHRRIDASLVDGGAGALVVI